MYPANLQNKIILNNTKLQTIENIKNEQKKDPAGKCDGKKISCRALRREKNFLPNRLLEKKILAGPKSSTPPPQKLNGRPLMREATSVVINIKKIWCCVSATWPIHDFTSKKSNIFFLKVRKLNKEEIDVEREFQILGPW